MEEPIARVEIVRKDSGAYTALITSETEGEKEITAANMDTLFRELTMDLEFVSGQLSGAEPTMEFSTEEEFENLDIQDNW